MLLLSSSAFDDPLLLPFLLRESGKSPEALRVSVVISASPMKATGSNALKTMGALTGGGVCQARFVDWADGKAAKDELRDSHVILINGGNPFLLLAAVQKADYLGELASLVDSDCIVVGVSAGGMLFASSLDIVEDFNRILGFEDKGNTESLVDLRGLGRFDEFFFPHYDLFSARVAGLSDQLDALEAQRNCRLYRQENGQTARVAGRVLVPL